MQVITMDGHAAIEPMSGEIDAATQQELLDATNSNQNCSALRGTSRSGQVDTGERDQQRY